MNMVLVSYTILHGMRVVCTVTGQLADATVDFACLVFVLLAACETASCPVRDLSSPRVGNPRVGVSASCPVTVCTRNAVSVACIGLVECCDDIACRATSTACSLTQSVSHRKPLPASAFSVIVFFSSVSVSLLSTFAIVQHGRLELIAAERRNKFPLKI